MSKTKMRCITCGKWFQSANAKEVTCPDCVQKARKDKSASKAAPQAAPRIPGQGLPGAGNPVRPNPSPPKPKTAPSGTSHWFDSLNDVKVSEPEPPPQRPRIPSSPAPHDTHGGPGTRGPGGYRDERVPGGYRGPGAHRDERGPGGPGGPGGYRGPGAYRNAPLTGSIAGGIGQRPRQPMDGSAPARGPRPSGPGERFHSEKRGGGRPQAPRKPKAPPAPRPKKEKIPPPEPFKPTAEQITQVEERYKELAIPSEFDGIRSQIAQELSIPKKAVKQIVKALRERESIPSWWETQTYKGDNEEKEKIQNAYQPYLPVPPVGVHRKIADELDLKPGIVYQAIKTIRSELNLPPYNDPQLHAEEFEEIKRKAREAREAREAAKAALAAEAAQKAAEAAETGASATIVVAEPTASDQTARSTPAGEQTGTTVAESVEVAAVSSENESRAE